LYFKSAPQILDTDTRYRYRVADILDFDSWFLVSWILNLKGQRALFNLTVGC